MWSVPVSRTLEDVGQDTDRAIGSVIDAHDEAMDSLRSPEPKVQIAAAVAVHQPATRIAILGIGPSAAQTVYVATLLAREGRSTITLNATGACSPTRCWTSGQVTHCWC